MTTRTREELVEKVAGAYRPRDVDGAILAHPAWHDLDERGRLEAYDVALTMRLMEAALDPHGLSTTAKAVLSMIRTSPRA